MGSSAVYSSRPVPTVLGSSGLAVSRMGLGLAALGRPGYINLGHASDLAGSTTVPSLERLTHSVLDAAYERGVRYFDAARSYGLAEAFLAAWLERRGLGPGEVSIGSKWGYTYVADWRVDAPVNEIKDLSVGALRRQLARAWSCLARICASTRSTLPRWKVESSRTARCSMSWPGCVPAGCLSG